MGSCEKRFYKAENHAITHNGILSINLFHRVKYSSNLSRHQQAWEFGISGW